MTRGGKSGSSKGISSDLQIAFYVSEIAQVKIFQVPSCEGKLFYFPMGGPYKRTVNQNATIVSDFPKVIKVQISLRMHPS